MRFKKNWVVPLLDGYFNMIMKFARFAHRCNGAGLLSKKVSIALVCLFAFSACGKEQVSDKGENMDKTMRTVYLKSKVSDNELPISLPSCVITGISEIVPRSQEQGKTTANVIDLRVERLAFSQPEFPAKLGCATEQNSKMATMYPASPLSEQEKQLLKTDPFAYLFHESVRVKEQHLAYKNDVDLYKASPVSDGVLVHKNFPGISRPLSISFIRFNPQTPNNSFRYYFNVRTILKGEYWLRYEVIATHKDPSQFAEKLRKIIEEDKNILDYPEVIAEFVANNEKIAAFFEKQQSVQ